MSHLLPEQFTDLELFMGWALAKETERNRKRLASTMAEMRAFYQAILPRIDAIIAYLNQFPLDNMPEEARRLLYLTLSLAEITPAVEIYGQPEVINSFQERGEAERFIAVHDRRHQERGESRKEEEKI
jgi:uncharacterized protein YecE (DUF72 family)